MVEYVYDSWGNHTIIADEANMPLANANPFRYRSYYYDRETNLYYLKSRYYDPEVCRFISQDSPLVSFIGNKYINGLNLYSYCFNNPVTFIDDEGDFPKRKPNFVRRNPRRHGAENRQPGGERERNIGHPNGEEHSRVAKGNRGPKTSRYEFSDSIIPQYYQTTIQEIKNSSNVNFEELNNYTPPQQTYDVDALNTYITIGVIALVFICVIGAFFTAGQSLWGLALI